MRLLLLSLLLGGLLVGGCTGQKQLITEQARTIDSLYTLEREMRRELYALQDSIRFYDEIESGEYFRERRTLRDRIDRLEYMLAIRADTLCSPEPVAMLLADDLFAPASTDLTDSGRELLAAVADTLQGAYARRRVRIEGHSDNVPVGGSLKELYPTNWELSAARATAVVRYLIDEHDLAPSRFEASALSDTAPVASNGSAAGRRQNRRIVVYVLPE